MEDPDGDPHLFVLNILAQSLDGNISISIIFQLLAIVVLLFLSALISGSETAYFSLNPIHLNGLNASAENIDRLILSHLKKPKRLLASILIINNFINVAIVILSSYTTETLFSFSNFPIVKRILEVVVITFLILFLGEILPKIYASQRPTFFASLMAHPLKFLMKLTYPLSEILVRSTSNIDKRMARYNRELSMSEISEAIDITTGEDAPIDGTRILKGIVKFTETEASEIMKSRVDVVALDSETKFQTLINTVIESAYSRIPVYTDSFDNVDGILYVKDLLPHLEKSDNFVWTQLIRPAFFVPENKKIKDLLQEIQEKKIHMAIVVDEYGGTSGIVTLEDILEEIVGEISDEFDSQKDEIEFSKIDDNNYIFEGKTSINDFCKIVGIDDNVLDEVIGEADSIAGLILELLGKIPEKNTIVNYKQFEFKVLTVDRRRIKLINVNIKESDNDKAS